jgi:hypothetical protein
MSSRWVPSVRFLASTFAAVWPFAIAACASVLEDDAHALDSEVTAVENTSVKNQSIGTCWIYTAAGWTESLHKAATSRDVDLSEGYWTFWFWYEQITGGDIGNFSAASTDGKTVVEAGFWGLTAEIMRRYGFMYEGDFIPDPDAKAGRHASALRAINASLASGKLALAVARKDAKLVREELYAAWKLEGGVRADMENVFGRQLDAAAPGASIAPIDDRVAAGPLGLTRVHAPHELPVIGADGKAIVTLSDVIGTPVPGRRLSDGARLGPEAWNDRRYAWPNTEAGQLRRRAFAKNVQDALNRRLAIPFLWWITSTARNGVYKVDGVNDKTLGALHASLLVDYEVEDVPGFGTLRVGKRETRPAALEAALDDRSHVTFFRIKNSWGDDPGWSAEEKKQFGPDALQDAGSNKPHYLPEMPGYNDLEVPFLDRPQAIWGDNDKMHMLVQLALPPKLRFEIPPL